MERASNRYDGRRFITARARAEDSLDPPPNLSLLLPPALFVVEAEKEDLENKAVDVFDDLLAFLLFIVVDVENRRTSTGI